jgi:hypothetical protein
MQLIVCQKLFIVFGVISLCFPLGLLDEYCGRAAVSFLSVVCSIEIVGCNLLVGANRVITVPTLFLPVETFDIVRLCYHVASSVSQFLVFVTRFIISLSFVSQL